MRGSGTLGSAAARHGWQSCDRPCWPGAGVALLRRESQVLHVWFLPSMFMQAVLGRLKAAGLDALELHGHRNEMRGRAKQLLHVCAC